MKNPITLISILVAVAFLYVAYLYFTTPANQLPAFLPGYDAALTKIHTTHGLAATILGLGALVLAWFQSGKKSAE